MREIKEELVTISAELAHDAETDERLAQEIEQAYIRFKRLDWGDTHPSDKPLNDQALETGARIIAKYQTCTEPIFIINSDEPYDVNRTTGEMIVKRITSIMYCHEY